MLNHSRPLTTVLLALLAIALTHAPRVAAQGISGWPISPYRIRVLVAVEVTSSSPEALAQAISRRLVERSDSAIGAVWDLSVEIVPAATRSEMLDIAFGREPSEPTLPAADRRLEKTLVIGVEEGALGLRVAAIEYDHNLLRWSQPLIDAVATLGSAPEAAFRQSCDIFSPVAEFRVSTSENNRIELTFRGEQLPVREGAPEWVREGDIFLPVLRRLNRDGEVEAEGIRAVPWTYLKLTELGDPPSGEFISHTRRPLASRRRGRVDYLAIRLPREPGETILRAHARDNPDKPLSGYQVFLQDGDQAERDLLGATGPDGRIAIPPGESSVVMAYIKSGSQLVAKIPVMPGAEVELEVPLLDETPRLQAEAKLGILREDLIDLVARRKILIARIDAAIDDEQYDQASKLVTDLERLPARALFDRQLRQLEQASVSDVPMVQKRIDRIFADTRTVLASFLNPREVQEVKNRLANARK